MSVETDSHAHPPPHHAQSGAARTLRDLLEGTSDPTVLLDRRLRVVFANAKARMLFSSVSLTEGGAFSAFLARALPGADFDVLGDTLRRAVEASEAAPSALFLRGAERELHLRISGVDCGCCGDAAAENQPVLAVMMFEPSGPDHLPRLEMVLDGSSDGVFIVNRENRIVYFNRACERLTGWQRDEAVMQMWECANVLHCHTESGESMGSESLCPAKLFFRHDAVPVPHEMLITTSGGREKWVETNYSPVRNQSGEVEYIVGIIRDIDERKQLEAQLVQSRNLASLGQLTSGIAHEIKNPLGIIMASVEVLLNEARPAAQRREAAHFIKDEVRRLDDRVKDFLAFARARPLNAERLELNALVSRVARSYSSVVSGRFRIELRPAQEGIWVVADPDQMHQVMLNLVINADQAMPHGGRLLLETEAAEDHALVRLTDEGSGIDPSDRERVFEPFFTTKKDGTGLGLPIVHQILTAHRGKITLRDNDGGRPGLTVEIRLPAAVSLS